MMKTEHSTNGEKEFEIKEHRRFDTGDEPEQKSSARGDESGNQAGRDKKASLFHRPGVIVVAAALAIVGIGYGGFAMFHSFTHEATDDAFIDVHFVSVAPKIAGRVTEVHVDDNQLVKKGDVLVEIDPRDFQIALAQAKANLAKDKAGQVQATANEQRAQDLFTRKVISNQDRDSNVATSQSSRASVEADQAAVEQAELNLSYTKITAPIGGYVTKEAVAAGDYVQVGQALMSLVPPRVWVIANFKETQLRSMHPRQPVEISVDAYPSLKLRGHVDSIQAGSGAAFSLLPPENATGNYVKVVQRVPVKIVVDERQEMQRVLGPGMSVVPTVAVDHGTEAAFVIAIIAVVLAAGVIFGAALWIRKGQA
ncbi:MAG TPA: HlyD family secretion protein [Chthoniobacterales bacterium]|nr:HlyD family secretion protein [Chthoniobacterales bacterium]